MFNQDTVGAVVLAALGAFCVWFAFKTRDDVFDIDDWKDPLPLGLIFCAALLFFIAYKAWTAVA